MRDRPSDPRRQASPRIRTPIARTTSAVVAVLGIVVGPAVAASAKPEPVFPSQQEVDRAKAAVQSKSAQVKELDARYAASMDALEQVRQHAAAVAEEYNGARYALQQRTRAAREAEQKARQAERKAQDASVLLRRYAAELYQQGGPLTDLEPFVDSTGLQDFIDRTTALRVVGELRDQQLREALAASQTAESMDRNAARAKAQQAAAAQEARAKKEAAEAQAARAAAEADRIGSEQRRMAAELATLRDTSVKVEQARQDGLRRAEEARRAAAEAAKRAREAAAREAAAREAAAKEQARKEAEAATKAAAEERARARSAQKAANSSGSGGSGSSSSSSGQARAGAPDPPTQTSRGVQAVLDYARAQIGKPYLWGGAGPNAFDCSGLTMMAWRQAGVYLTHYTGAQWNETRRVAIADLRPGDLVFYGVSGPTSHHMGLYVGGGMMIEAPYTGAYVRYASIYRSELLPYGGRP